MERGYSFTGAVDTVRVDVNVGYGSSLTAETVYTYGKGRKTKVGLSVSHGMPAVSRETTYTYDAIGRLSGKERQLTGTGKSLCSYSYDVHGWLTSVTDGEFQERLYYADGLDGGCWNGNISTMKWRSGDNGLYEGYNLKYDGNNRLYSALFGSGDNLTGSRNYFSENVEYDSNGNITRLWRYGLTDNLHGGFGLVDNLYMTYMGNMLTSVRDVASRLPYAGATDFDGMPGENPLTYNASGSLVSDAGRGIARIDYDRQNNPVRIQFTDGSVTRYVYGAAGEKLRVTHLTAVPNITVPIGSTRELSPSEILSADSTDYLLGGSLTLRNGRIDKLQFEEGYCQAVAYTGNPSRDNFTFQYYDRDHLGNIRQVIKAIGSNKGTVIQTMDYYPFGAQFCGGSYDSNVQSRRYNGKELDKMHGLDTYDYGARQYNPVTARWDRVDPLSEKYYSVSPYGYCGNNPVRYIDPYGRDEWEFNSKGYMVNCIENDKYDGFFFVNDDGERIAGKSLILDYGSVLNYSQRAKSENEEYDVFELKGSDHTKDLFTFLADNSSVEWELATGGWIASGADIDYLTTSHNEGTEIGMPALIETQLSKGYHLLNLYHNHPGGSTFPSGLGYNVLSNFKDGDKQYAEYVTGLFGNDVRFYIYTSDKKQFTRYGPNSSLADFPEFWDFHGKK